MKTRILLILTLIVGALLFSCGTNKSTQTVEVDTNTLRTEAVATYASSLTGTVVTVPTKSPTPIILEPTITPTAITVTPEIPPTADPCYKLKYIDDLTIRDGTAMKAGEVFTKTWLVQNSGGCAWRPGFTFANVGGDPMRGNLVTITDTVPPGSKQELTLQLVVPSGQNGVILSSWRMADKNGAFFGDTLSVNIVVGDSTTPAVTSTP
jgi:hypothetical protein